MLRIGIDARILNTVRRTGIGVYTHNLVYSLASHSPNAIFFLLYPAWGRREILAWDYDSFPNLFIKGAMVPDTIREDRFYRAWLDWYLPMAIRWMKLDIFHGPANLIPSTASAEKVLTVHDLSFIVVPDLAFDSSPAFLRRFEQSVREADAIITVSECTKGDLVKYCGAKAEKIAVIYEGVNPGFRVLDSSAVEDAWRSRLGISRRFILGPLSLHPRKNPINIIRAYAMAREKGCRHALVLPGKDYGRNECRRLVEELGLQEHVLFPGYVDNEELLALYNLTDVFVYPSLYEGFGLPILEAMSCGCPVIASDRGSIPEVGGEAVYYVNPENPEDIAEGITSIITSSAMRDALIEKGFARLPLFSWQKCAEKTMEIYRRLAIRGRA